MPLCSKLCPVFLLIFFLSCQNKSKEEVTLFKLIPPAESGLSFENKLQETDDINIITFEYFYNGAGIGVGDFNHDGLPDLFFAANLTQNKLFLNSVNFQFEDITEQAGIINRGKWATGVSVVDINQDGWDDIYLCFAGPALDPGHRANELYINQKDGTFKEMAGAYGLADSGHSTMAVFFDYDLDGDLDMYLLTNITDTKGPNIIRPKYINGEMVNTDRLYRNEGAGEEGHPVYKNVSKEAGITIEGYGLGVSVADINQDGWPDIYVSNDYLSNDLLYINNTDGTFSDRAADIFKHQSYSAMGNDIADFNNDALPDIITLDMLPPDNRRQKLMFGETNYNRFRSEVQSGYAPQFMRNSLQWHQGFKEGGDPAFSEISQMAGVHATDWSWSALWADLDLDGHRDLLVTNGYPRDITNRDFALYKMQEFSKASYNEKMKISFVEAVKKIDGAYLPNFVFKNQGNLSFADFSVAWGFDRPSYSTGAAYVDLDNDGDLDYVTNNIDAPAFLYKNMARERDNSGFLQISLEGLKGNISGLGAKVWLYYDSQTLFSEHYPFRGYQSTVDSRIHFGIGETQSIDSLRILWPSGHEQVIYNPEINQHLILKIKDAHPVDQINIKSKASHPIFSNTNQKRGIYFDHQEQHYSDFNVQVLLPHKLSQQGPAVAVADVNGDGLEDFFVGGAFKQSGRFFIQKKNGTFTSLPISDTIKFEEDHGALFFDVDGDGDQDLYIVSGGNEFQLGSPYYQDRLYINDGNGNFSLNKAALPALNTASSCVVAADFDQDGDLDLFIGGRNRPQGYPAPGISYLLENQQGKFVDVTEKLAPGLKSAGMVTSAIWTDIDQDGWPDLMLVGEWMSPAIFRNMKGKMERLDIPEFRGLTGWWNSLVGGDFDQDGDIDYVAGNLGVNSRYRADSLMPLKIYVNDFNGDGKMNGIMAYNVKDIFYPVHPRDDLLRQLNYLKKSFPSYSSFADANIQGILTPQQLKSSTIMESRQTQSLYFENLGNFKFKIKSLPIEAQTAPVYGMLCGDYNNDSYPDLLLIGNSYATEVINGPHDALNGVLLLGDGKNNFRNSASGSNGFWVEGDGKSLANLKLSDGKELILASQNNGELLVYEPEAESRKYVSPGENQNKANILFKDGRKQKVEFYWGSGYFGQSTRGTWLNPEFIESVEFTP